MSRDLLEESQVGDGIEHLLTPVEEPSCMNVDAPEHLHGRALARDGNHGLAAASCPGVVQRRVLSKRCLIGVDQRRPERCGFFFKLGYV